ncbi:hypothetical protein [Allorhodopirellula heiligendammensis]|nr:hypothetical protein [Allorhodopirellula heiligendammensis]
MSLDPTAPPLGQTIATHRVGIRIGELLTTGQDFKQGKLARHGILTAQLL